MIYLEHTTEMQKVYIPKTWRRSEGMVFLHLFGTTNLVNLIKEVELLEETSAYHIIEVSLPHVIAEGEYEYDLKDDNGLLSTGVAVVGEPDKVIEYNNAVTYEQYN